MRPPFPFLLLAATVAACDAPAQHDAVAASSASAPSISVPNSGGLIPGTPEGDLADWTADIRAGLAEVSVLAAKDIGEAQRKALDLYVTRQEYAEMYYGVDGRQRATDELAEAIETAEERFHVLMKLLANPTAAVTDVESAVAALTEQQALVAELWRAAGVSLPRTAS